MDALGACEVAGGVGLKGGSMLDKSKIGCANEERVITVEAGMVRLFCQAIGETNPIFLDAEAAKAAGHPAVVTPPTYASCLNNLAPAEQDLVRDVLGADLGRLLHGEQVFTLKRPIYVGDRIRMSQRIADIYDKKNGALEFVVLDTELKNQRDELCAIVRSVVVVRN
jgi:acyl dehydratase